MADNNFIKNFIEKLGFTANLFTYSKEYKLQNYTIRIDLKKGKIFYREDDKTVVERFEDGQIQIGDKTTSNFSQEENFVVLEVVDRLLTKGYMPNDIHLERRYPSGRGASGGKSDVCVYGKDGKSLMVIECKTWGQEFEKERQKMETHGGQLFAYLANDQNTKFLVLYASKLTEEGKFDYENLIVQVKDREEDLKKSLKQVEEENIKLYRDANNKAELYEVWKEEFILYFHFNGIFDDDANAYSLELKALKKKNLKPLENAQGLFNKFAEILRHNNISDNANAFNKILSLFLCKIVDEEKNDEDILGFQVKEDEEYEHLIDRLQFLYQKGMEKLNEEIVYYSEKDLHTIIKLYPKQTPIESIVDVFKELKYYTNNEFAFKEVHNKKLFRQNGRVLTEIVKLIQNFRFRYNSQQQVLGDFFELMLNHGVKQSEGQFFTPIPIVRYIILSLGFEKIIQRKLENDESFILPKILDYACGAGHFLTESIEELQNILQKTDISKLTEEQQTKIEKYRENTYWAKDYIFGIEKDYRLARTSQIACYINGDGEANIIFGDGLEDHNLDLDKKKFDVVITNPPYSVSSFKNYLNVGKINFDLFEHLSEKSSQIEALFVERTKQVLADNGLAGIILPSTILSNTGIYTKARETLLKYFEIKAITELGSKTFIATGTTTVILFLKRRNDDFLKDREYISEDVFNGINIDTNKRYIKEKRFIELFCEHREFNSKDYIRFLKLELNNSLAETEMFKEYKEAFDKSTEIVNLKKKTYFEKYSAEEKEEELTKRFYNYCKDIEKEKFLYFMLCLGDAEKDAERIEEYYKPQQTVIVKTGNTNDQQKEFLGYEFQGKKGQEGIKINNYGGKLFAPENYLNPQKANSYIRKYITDGFVPKINENQKEHTSNYQLLDLLDFEKIEFEKIISYSNVTSKPITSKYPMVKFDKIASLEYGDSLPESKRIEGEYPVYGSNGIVGYHNSYIATAPTIIVGRKGSAGKTNYVNENCFPIDTTYYVKLIDKSVNMKYFFYLLSLANFEQFAVGVGVPGLSRNDVYKIKIPNVPINVQEKIILEIEKVEQKESNGLERIKELEQAIKTDFQQSIIDKPKVKVDTVIELQNGKGLSQKNIVKGDYPVYGGNGIYGYHNEYYIEKETIAIGRVGEYCGAIHIVPAKSWISDNSMYVTKFKKEVNIKYLAMVLADINLNQYAKRSSQPSISQPNVLSQSIPLPSIEEQKKLIKEIDKKEMQINKIKDSLTNIQEEKEEILRKYL